MHAGLCPVYRVLYDERGGLRFFARELTSGGNEVKGGRVIVLSHPSRKWRGLDGAPTVAGP